MNSLKIDIKEGTKVVMEGPGPESERVVTVVGGFGSYADTMGTALFVNYKGDAIRFDSMEIEKLHEDK